MRAMAIRRIRPWILCAWVCAIGGATSCGGDNGGSSGGMQTRVHVTVSEFQVVPATARASAGRVTFAVTNTGTELHEFVVVRTDLAPDALPTAADGSFDEEGANVDVLGEIPEFAPGPTYLLTLDLVAGHYVLLCNRVEVEDGETVAHYHEGMRTSFSID